MVMYVPNGRALLVKVTNKFVKGDPSMIAQAICFRWAGRPYFEIRVYMIVKINH